MPSIIFYIFLGLAVVGIISVYFAIRIKRNKEGYEDYKNGTRICVHTIEDCENCRVSGSCTQRNGKGLLFRKE